MCSRFRIEAGLLLLLPLAACQPPQTPMPGVGPPVAGAPLVRTSALVPGVDREILPRDPRALAYYDNPQAVVDGKRLFQQFNCSGCHSNGGGGMGPDLMDGTWIYGSRLEQIHQTLVEGRPNGMPSWADKIPDPQLWELAAYVRSMSLPRTLAAQNGPTPSQTPAPVPRAVDQDPGWSPSPDTSNDYGTTIVGPQ